MGKLKHRMYCAKSGMACAVFHEDGICPDVRDCEGCAAERQDTGNDLVAPQPLTTPDVANPPTSPMMMSQAGLEEVMASITPTDTTELDNLANLPAHKQPVTLGEKLTTEELQTILVWRDRAITTTLEGLLEQKVFYRLESHNLSEAAIPVSVIQQAIKEQQAERGQS